MENRKIIIYLTSYVNLIGNVSPLSNKLPTFECINLAFQHCSLAFQPFWTYIIGTNLGFTAKSSDYEIFNLNVRNLSKHFLNFIDLELRNMCIFFVVDKIGKIGFVFRCNM